MPIDKVPPVPPDKKLTVPDFPDPFLNKKSDKSLFQKRPVGLSRGELRENLKNTKYDPNVKMLKQERVGLEKELFSYQKYGSNISQSDVNRRLLLLNKEKFKAQHTEDKLKIQHEINLLNKLKNQKLK